MQNTVEVLPYSIDALDEILGRCTKATKDIIQSKLHRVFLNEYFSKLSARTIVVEYKYIDRDYLEDFAAYYIRCFENYESTCTRLHFFDIAFDLTAFMAALEGEEGAGFLESIKQAYLGFIVVKNLPSTFIGRTCLRPYPAHGVRCFPIVREYKAGLFGIPLEVRSLAYQEQDRVVAACATSALWSIFQGTGILFHHRIPSPVEITRIATSQFALESRSIPSNGLNAQQMAHAIRTVGLEPFLIKVKDEAILKNSAYAYLKGGIPVLLGVKLVDQTTKEPSEGGGHAIAITGFSISESQGKKDPLTGMHLNAYGIDKFYGHDDQVGPFARMTFDGIKYKKEKGSAEEFSLSTSWKDKSGKLGGIRAVPLYILVPLYHKIRIPFSFVQEVMVEFDGIIAQVGKNVPGLITFAFEYDLFLISNNDFKKELKESGKIKGHRLSRYLLTSLPKYLWRANIKVSGKDVFDFLFDATDIEQGNIFLLAVEYEKEISTVIRCLSKELSVAIRNSRSLGVRKIFEWFESETTQVLKPEMS